MDPQTYRRRTKLEETVQKVRRAESNVERATQQSVKSRNMQEDAF
jgi:hypothetical protein